MSSIEYIKNAKVDLILSDPPYGCNNNCDYTRFTKNAAPSKKFKQIKGDNEKFNPTVWLQFPKVVLFGYQYFADKLPIGTILFWNKRRENKIGKFLSDGELAWMKGGKGVYLFNYIWDGFDRQGERGKSLHPSQKPVALMKWIIEKQKLPPNSLICDPYMGSGPVGIAALELGHRFLGFELEKDYYDISKNRLEEHKKKV